MNDQKASVGWFQDSGYHKPAEMSYASLAYLHAFPSETSPHKTRDVLGYIKPFKGEGRNRIFFKEILRKYIALKATFEVEDVLSAIGAAWKQKGSYVFGNASILDHSWSSTPLVETGRLERSFGFRTSINYTLRYA